MMRREDAAVMRREDAAVMRSRGCCCAEEERILWDKKSILFL